jgi:quercetin dioxygenase-like cupin family protein
MQLERIPWPGPEAPEESALRERLEREGFSAFSWRDAPGATYSAHSHDHDESLWVVDGEITFGAEGEELRLAPGDRLMLPRGTVHTARAGPRGATYLIGERTGRAPRQRS